jgi:hypothetical protein
VEDGVCMPQLLDVLLKRAQMQMLLDDGPSSARLHVKHVLHVPGQRNHGDVEVRALGLDTASRHCLHTGSSWLRIRKSAIGIAAVSARRLSHKEVSATCAVCSTVSSRSTPMTVAIHGSVELRGITMLTSHFSWPLAIDM